MPSVLTVKYDVHSANQIDTVILLEASPTPNDVIDHDISAPSKPTASREPKPDYVRLALIQAALELGQLQQRADELQYREIEKDIEVASFVAASKVVIIVCVIWQWRSIKISHLFNKVFEGKCFQYVVNCFIAIV